MNDHEFYIVQDEYDSGEAFSTIYRDTEKEEGILIANFYGEGHELNAELARRALEEERKR